MTSAVGHSELKACARQGFAVELRGVGDIDDDFRERWRDLDNAAETANPFFTSWFLEPALNYLNPAGDVRLCALRRAHDGLLIGVLPLTVGRRYAKLPLKHFAVWKHQHCYCGAPLIRQGFSQPFYTALIDWLDTRPEGVRFLRLSEFPLTTRNEENLNAACADRHREYFTQYRRERAIMSGGQNANDVIACSFSGKKRKELRRQARRMEERGDFRVQFECDADQVADAATSFLSLESSGWKGRRPHAFPMARSKAERKFFSAIIEQGAGAVSCDSLMLGRAPAAMLFSLRCGDNICAFKIAHDESLNAYSPGVLLLQEATKRLLSDETVKLFDSCARSGHPVADKLWRERMTVAQINIPAAGAMDSVLLRLCAGLEKAKFALLPETPLGEAQ